MGEKRGWRYDRVLLAILICSLLLRIKLVLSGGQFFFPDEVRYEAASVAVRNLLIGDIFNSLRALHSAEHFLFKVAGVVPAMLQLVLGPSPKIPAIFFSLFSVVSLWLIWKIARRAGGSERAATLAAGLFALSTTQFYFSRHLVPYDLAMAIGLLSLYLGQRSPARAIDSILCGFTAACCFLTYNGYWVLGGLAILLHIAQHWQSLARAVRLAGLSLVGLVVPIAAIIVFSRIAGGDLLGQFVAFSKTVVQGDFSEGWILPLKYLWHSEYLLALPWVAALIGGLWETSLGRASRPVRQAVVAIIFIYGVLILFSVFLGKFVVYGRLARQLVPFLSLLSASYIDRLLTSRPKIGPLIAAVLLVVIGQATYNFRQVLALTFPSEFMEMASEATGERFTMRPSDLYGTVPPPTDSGSPVERFPMNTPGSWSEAPVTAESENYQVLFAHFIYPAPLPATESGEIILQRDHPQQFLPLQYEGGTPEDRRRFREVDFRMKLVRRSGPRLPSSVEGRE